MRRSSTLDRAPSQPTASTRAGVVGQFRLAHVGLAALHLAQALLVLAVAGDVVIDVTHRAGNDAAAPLVGVSVGVAMAAYFLAAVVHHTLSAGLLNPLYEDDLRRGRNRIRWVEFLVSAPILMGLIALYTGVTDVTVLVVVGAATVMMICCGWIQETVNPPTRRTTTMVPFWAGSVAGAVPWAIVAGEMIGSTDRPEFGFSIFLSLFILWASFGVNQWLQYRQIGPWGDYLYGERTYLVLSLVAKTALAWQIVAGSSLT